MPNVKVIPDEALNMPELVEDHPINLRDQELLANPKLLPNMRLLHHDAELLELTLEILLWAARAGFQNSSGDRNKME